MRIHTDHDDPIFELSESDLADVQTLALVAEHVEAGAFVYCPPTEASPASTRDVKEPREDSIGRGFYADPAPVMMHTQRLDDPARLDALRVALAPYGLTLTHLGGFHARIDAVRAASGKRCAS